MQYIYFLNQFDDSVNENILGGKGYHLAQLAKYGFTVPRGFTCTTHIYDEFMTQNGLNYLVSNLSEKLKTTNLEEKAIQDELNQLRQLIMNSSFPEEILIQIKDSLHQQSLHVKSVAVRSSASLEDSSVASFAGIHESFLNVIGINPIIESIKKCYASLWTQRAVSYRKKMGFENNEIKQAVVIMELINGKSSGVAFTCDPLSGRTDTIVINANFGLGESLVSGNIEPDQYQLMTKNLIPTITDIRIGRKEGKTVALDEGGIQFSPSTDPTQVLSEQQIVQLSMIVQRVYDSLGQGMVHQDIEWVLDGSQFMLVQARPVTQIPNYTYFQLKSQPDIWSNANMKDAMPMVQTIFGWQFLKRFSEAILSSPLKLTGYKAMPGLEYSKLFYGRGYFNLSLMQWEFYDALGVTPKEANEMSGGHQPEVIVPPPTNTEKLKRTTRLLKLARAMLKEGKRANIAFERVTKFTSKYVTRDFREIDDEQLISELEEVLSEAYQYAQTIALVTNAAALSFNNLTKILEKDFPGRGSSVSNQLIMGKGNITSAEHGYQLVKLAQVVDEDLEAQKFFFKEKNYYPTEWEKKLPDHSPFKKAFVEYLSQFGHRGIYEGDISNPRWREDPTYLLNYVRSILGEVEFTQLKERQNKISEDAWKKTMDQIPMYRKTIVKWMVKKAIYSAEMREMAKSQLVRFAEPSRLIALEMGRRFVENDLIENVNDIFHCSWAEVVSILRGEWNGDCLRVIVEERKLKMEENNSIPPPDTIIDGISHEHPPLDTKSYSNSKSLNGLGVATGRSEGLVRIIRHPEQGGQLKQGEILVAPSTDPAWTPLFLKASGIIMETGGFLSHGAIVSREYGIPAVVNVPGVTNKLNDGDRVIVDGDEGKVYLVR